MRITLRIAAVLALAGSLTACRANIPDGIFACSDHDDCDESQRCIEGFCYEDEVDGSVSADGGAQDGGADDATLDAPSPDAFVDPADAGSDAPLTADDAFVEIDAHVVPDAFVEPIDAFVGLDAHVVPDAFVPPDAFTPADAFVPTDAGCSRSPCGLLPQCGCPAGQGCYPFPATDMCVVSGTRGEGASCTESFQCSPGMACADVDGASPATPMCGQLCRPGVHDDCLGDALCANGIGRADIGLCSFRCSLAPASGCVAGLECVLFQADLGGGVRPFFTDCVRSVGTGGAGTLCTDHTSCAPGLACASGDADPTPRCRPYCDVTAPSCAGGETCRLLATVDGTSWGACAP